MAAMHSSEELREKLVLLQRDNEALRTEAAHAGLLLNALETLLRIGHETDPFSGVFHALDHVFAFDQAMVLAETDDHLLECVAAAPVVLLGLRGPSSPFLERVMAGRVSATFGNGALQEWNAPPDLLSPGQHALYLPIRVRERRGVLILLRAPQAAGFDRAHVALARKFAVLASAALAARNATQDEAESQRLRLLTEQLQRSEQNSQRNADLLNEIVSLLPVGLTVQDDQGRFILVNAAAAANIGQPADRLAGASPADFLPEVEATGWRQRHQAALRAGGIVSSEKTLTLPAGERTLLMAHKPVRIFDEKLVLSTALDITERKRAEEELARRAYYDDLTGLPNRALIQRQVEQVLHRVGDDGQLAFAFIDLDNFKQINDYYSHAVGDAILVEVARRLRARLRSSDILARISGDEFVLLIQPLTRSDQLDGIIDGVLEELKQPFHIEGFEIFTSASVGVSIYPKHGRDYESLRRTADSAMYRAKNTRKGGAAYYDAATGQIVTARMELEQRLRVAIRDQRLCCAFQPKVDIRTRAVVGFEALVRWRDENGAITAPGEFVGLAVELGLIEQITYSVLGSASAAMPELDRVFGPALPISINIAAKQANNVGFMHAFLGALRETGEPDRFMLELTEDAFVSKGQFQTQVMPMLREAGVRVSIDDFGTGYSSLSALADITVDEIKVDRSFITDIHRRPRSQTMFKAIESMSQALGIDVVAEGVETAEEVAYLQGATRIRHAQGYYFARPMFLEQISDQRRAVGT
jgi:cyclic di-GMP phosphodiesterase Gmr